MSLITCCPTCGTRFRVVPDQLKMADGWVRCGQCAEVFDAQLSLVTVPVTDAAESSVDDTIVPLPELPVASPEPAPEADAPVFPDAQVTTPAESATPSAPVLEAPEPQESAPAPDADPIDPIVMLDDGTPDVPEATDAPDEAPSTERVEPVLDFEIPDEDIAAAASTAGPPAPSADASEAAVAQDALASTQAAQADAADAPAPAVASDTPPDDAPTFVRQAYRRAFWRRPEMRVLLVLLGLLLGLLMAAQIAVQQRDLLAAQAPALRPLLFALCKPLQCRVGPPQRIESIVIDGSSFTRLRPDAYRLSVTLSNQAGTPVAMPALELTLTDTQDQPVLRRVLQPVDLGPDAPAIMAAHGEWSSTLTLAVAANAGTARIAGYRLLAFYP